MQNRAEFLAERRTGIGSSDAASLMNVGYGCKRRLWYEKVGVPADYPFEGNNLTRLGQALEPLFRELYMEETKREVFQDGLHRHIDLPFLLAHPDGRIGGKEDTRSHGVLEVKALGRAMFYRSKREGVSEDYILQVQWAMMVTGAIWGSFAIGSRDNGDLLYFDFDRNWDLSDTLEQEGIEFWKTVEIGRDELRNLHYPEIGMSNALALAPPRLSPDDARCHQCGWRDTCQGAALMEIAKKDDGSIAEANELFPLYAEYKQRSGMVKEAEDLLDETKEELKTAIGDRTAVSVNGRKILWRPQTAMRWDGEELATTHEHMRKMLKAALTRDGVGEVEFDKRYPPAQKKPSVSRPFRCF